MTRDVPVTAIEAATYVITTDAPEADGTLAWFLSTAAVASAATTTTGPASRYFLMSRRASTAGPSPTRPASSTPAPSTASRST
jgi:hypothetical protein